MNEQEKALLIEVDQRAKSNSHRLDSVEEAIRDIQNDQKAIYKIATSVEVIAQRVSAIEDKVGDTNIQVSKLSEKVNEAEKRPDQQVAANWNSVKVAIITAICTLLATGAVGALITLVQQSS